jgi:hypothetical protein
MLEHCFVAMEMQPEWPILNGIANIETNLQLFI